MLPVAYAGKRPLTRHGLHDATTDPAVIALWSTAAEFAVVKWLEQPIEIRFTVGKGDVGPLEVRWAQEQHYGLLVPPDDPDEPPYLLVTGRAGLYRLCGWAYGREAKQAEWLCSPNGRPPVHIVPRGACARSRRWPRASSRRGGGRRSCWRAYLGGDDLDEPGEVCFYCPDCGEREFAGD